MAEAPTAAFRVEASDELHRAYTLAYWDSDGSLSLYDTAAKRVFLRRLIPPERISLDSFFLGARLVIAARSYVVTDYADEATRRTFAAVRGSTLLLIKPEAYHSAGKIISMVHAARLTVGKLRMVRFSHEEAAHFVSLCPSASRESAADLAVDHMLALEVVGDDVLARVHELVGPADPADARALVPLSIRALLGKSRAKNAVHVPLSREDAATELAFIFERVYPYTGVFTHCAVCIIKPHAVASNAAGEIIDAILKADLEISAMRSMVVSTTDAADYYAPYRGVCREHEAWISHLASGQSIIMELRGHDVVPRLRELAGPYDPVVARALRPDSLRARFGVDAVRNALQVTDIDVDGPLETKFFFHVLP